MPQATRWAGSFSEDRPVGWDPVAVGNRAGNGMARFVSEEKATGTPIRAASCSIDKIYQYFRIYNSSVLYYNEVNNFTYTNYRRDLPCW